MTQTTNRNAAAANRARRTIASFYAPGERKRMLEGPLDLVLTAGVTALLNANALIAEEGGSFNCSEKAHKSRADLAAAIATLSRFRL